ncbi:MAG TPA: UvrD-helicase domain-containing protein, partial [Bryobacteraceae bacterium]
AITFTEKGAGNMRKKLAETFQADSAIRGRLERAWVSTVHGFCARLLKENAVFAGVDPEFVVADERESWRLQQESMAAAMEEIFQEHPLGIRTLIRGLSSYSFEEAVLSAYDAMRGAGVRVEGLARYPTPRDTTIDEIAAAINALRSEKLSGWNPAQKEQLHEALECAERIVSAAGPLQALRAIEKFSCSLQKCKKGNQAYNLLKHLKDTLVKNAAYGLITQFYAPQRQLLLEILERFDRIYRQRKRANGALDFSDLEEFAVRLLDEHSETRARVQGQFDHILMDEFQDTNGQQSSLLKLVRAPDRFYAVGDINQSIFGFRHAEPRGFAQYRDEVSGGGGRLVELIDNFRSRPEILSAVETILAGAPGIEPRSLVAGRKFETALPVAVEVMSVAGPERSEAQWVAKRILELVGDEFTFRDVALLVRNTEVLAEFTAAFDEAGIPYLVNRGKGFYETREVNDLTHLLRVIANPRDEVSLATVLRSPLVGASDEALLRLKMPGDNLGEALGRVSETAGGFDAGDLLKLRSFRDRLGQWRARRESVSFDRLLLQAMDDCGYPTSPNIDKFLALARDAAGRWSLDEFVAELSLVRASNPREPDAPPEDSANAVKVMTVHSAKGLEFPIVFLGALQKGIQTALPHVAFSPQFGLGARWRNPAEGKEREKNDLYQHAIHQEIKVRERDESNRLLYVAMTRAEHHLVLSFSRNERKLTNWAAVVTDSLQLDPDTPREEVVTYTAPDGKNWKARVFVTDRAPDLVAHRPADAVEQSLEFVSPPQVDGQHDTNATVTALAKFAVCPREYYLANYLG